MATIKSYTDIEQSRTLAKILAIETSDYYYPVTYIEETTNKYLLCYIKPYIGRLSEIKNSVDTTLYIPCRSLAALLNVLPKYEIYNNGKTIQLDVNLEALATEGDGTLLDLVVNMIIHLHELKML